jgi:ADP-heptose:LPS heptosyltransferase
MPEKIILRNFQSPGDLIMMSYAIKSLHEAYPGQYITDVRASHKEIFANHPYIMKVSDAEADKIIDLEYPTIHLSNRWPVQFLTAFTMDLSRKLGVSIFPCGWTPGVFLSKAEAIESPIANVVGRHVPYWIIDAGHKLDFTAKGWSFDRYQQIVKEFPDVWFVQIGRTGKNHAHQNLVGDNLINLIDKTSLRDLIQITYHSFGVITPVSLPMHLAYAVSPNLRFGRSIRPSIVIAGGREPNTWVNAPGQHYLHTIGMLKCCQNGGCWRSRVVPLDDGQDELNKRPCELPVVMDNGQTIPQCMEMISVENVCDIIQKYMSQLEYQPSF